MAASTILSRSALLSYTAFSRSHPGHRRSFARHMASATGYYVLQYSYVPDIAEKRTSYRADHLAAAKKGLAEKKIVIVGAVGDPIDGGLFIFQNTSKEEIEEYVKSDVYNQNGLITSYTIKPYMVVKE